jgi:hypothetical protein
MKKLKFFLIFFFICSLTPGFLVAYIIFRPPDFSKKRCELVQENYKKIQIEMNKEEVLLLIGKEPRYKVYPYAGVVFPYQKTQWEIWMLCKEKPYKWQMIAFDIETEKVVKIFSDDPERVGFE